MTITTGTGTTLPSDTVERFRALREDGWTYQQIGAETGYSHETVRRLVGDTVDKSWAEQKREARSHLIAEITSWLEAHGPVTRDMVMAHFDLSDDQLTRLIADGVPGWLVMTSARDTTAVFTDDQIDDAVRRAWEVEQRVAPGASGLAYLRYDEVRQPDDPSAPLIVSRHGWSDVCHRAGVPHGERPAYLRGFESRWDDDALLDHVAAFVAECREAKAKPGASSYAAWAAGSDVRPSLSTVRNRMRQAGVEDWPSVVLAAIHR